MADTFYSLTNGEGFDPNGVTVGASTSGEAIELRVVDGAGITKKNLLNALDTIRHAIIKRSNPA